jgi:hypothetical protein
MTNNKINSRTLQTPTAGGAGQGQGRQQPQRQQKRRRRLQQRIICNRSNASNRRDARNSDAMVTAVTPTTAATTATAGIQHRWGRWLLRWSQRLNMELDLQSLFGLLYSAETLATPPSHSIWVHIRGRHWSAKIDDISL